MLLDPLDWSLSYRAEEVVDGLPADLAQRVSLETHASVIELTTGVHTRVTAAAAELADLRVRLARALASEGLRACGTGTHPTAVWEDTVLSTEQRYRDIAATMRVLARREPTAALHVHVGIADAETAVRVHNRMRAHLPLLLALSANSPFWRADSTGLLSTRMPIFRAFPRVGIPPTYKNWEEYS